jgi:ribosome-associated protein
MSKAEAFSDSHEKALYCARLACSKKARELVILELKGHSSLADYFIICGGTSDRHVRAVAEHLELNLKARGSQALGIEGLREGKWVLLDCADVIIHVFQEKEREFYDLESLWVECPRIAFRDSDEP